MPTIFDLVKASEIVAYWDTLAQDREPFLGEELFPSDKKLGLKLDWIKGSGGLPVVLAPSAFDAAVKPRPRIGFDVLSSNMPFFKESKYVDEELRQQLNMVLETGRQGYIDSVLNRVFNDTAELLTAASSQRERMRMMALTTGVISITANGQNYDIDYGVPNGNKPTADVSWADGDTDILADIRAWQDKVQDETGTRPTRAIVSQKTWSYLQKNTVINKSIYILSGGGVVLSDNRLRQYLMEELGLEVVVYTKRYKNEAGVVTKYVPDDTFILFPDGPLGNTWFGTTPEESDLLSSNVANVAITDVGVAVTTMTKADPVNVETKVSMICLPSFEQADKIVIADIIP